MMKAIIVLCQILHIFLEIQVKKKKKKKKPQGIWKYVLT